jgi:tRNA (cmo5U34)-methyltransferase
MKDKVFSKDIQKKFEFDEAVASVFDDMLSRSVPFYKENQELLIEYILHNLKEKSVVTDLGCSTATFLLELFQKSSKELKLIGIDNSVAMLERARKKALAYGAEIEFIEDDILEVVLPQSDFFVANYTLQFIRPLKRPKLVQNIYKSLSEDGKFIFSEKVVFEDKVFDKQIIDIYYKYKKSQGYSEVEIAKKREALENVLIPFTIAENIAMCKEAGFKSVQTLFQWGNFVSFIALK